MCSASHSIDSQKNVTMEAPMTKTLVRKKLSAAVPAKSAAAWHVKASGKVQTLQSAAFTKEDWLVHGFSTRLGGVSKGGALNLGFTDWDARENVAENRRCFFRAIGAEKMRPVALRQIHSDVILTIGAGADNIEPRTGDALITREPGVLLIAQTADCIPILLADPQTKSVAAIHSGWRGTLAGIAEKTIGRMRMELGARPENIIAAIGPGIGRCCYEVGGEVAQQFEARYAGAREWFEGPFDKLAAGENDPNWLPWLTMRPPGHAPPPLRVHLDLIAANRAILAAAGVRPANISASDSCTSCRTDLFFSYRRERATGRMMAAIGIL
jgi:polyphenol oxidase